MEFIQNISLLVGVVAVLVVLGFLVMIVRCYRKVDQGQALVRNGLGGTKVSFSGIVVLPVIHKPEFMDISVKRVEIDRAGVNGLICRDNMRADIKVAFFVRVNQTSQDVLKVAQSIGCPRASSQDAIVELFDAKFSEALKTVGRQFDFIELYNSREKLFDDIIQLIGTDLNGFVLEDVAIDYLEQTPLKLLNPDNILDAEGIKKITELTASQKVLANKIDRDREKTIKQQDVAAREAILELERQLAEAEEKQKREVASVTAREQAEAKKVQAENLQRSEQARIQAEEEIQIAEENKNRQVIVARKNKERTEAVETERVERDRLIEVTERERLVELANIEKNKAIEVEQKAIQDVIRERLVVEKSAVEERERIKDTEAIAMADRQKKVQITAAEMEAEQALVKDIKAAEAARKAAELHAEQEMFTRVKLAEAEKDAAELRAQEILISAEAEQAAAVKQADAKKTLADATAAETAASGLGEARVIEAKADAEAKGLHQKAAAMKALDGVGREHEEFKLRLNKERDIELAGITVQRDIAEQQALVIGEALKVAKIDIVGGDAQFFDKITGAIANGKAVDRLVGGSETLTEIKDTFFTGEPADFGKRMAEWFKLFGVSTEDVKNLTVAAALGKLISEADDDRTRGVLGTLLHRATRAGLSAKTIGSLDGSLTAR
jgi:uncharacterized membrane protein YqiK